MSNMRTRTFYYSFDEDDFYSEFHTTEAVFSFGLEQGNERTLVEEMEKGSVWSTDVQFSCSDKYTARTVTGHCRQLSPTMWAFEPTNSPTTVINFLSREPEAAKEEADEEDFYG